MEPVETFASQTDDSGRLTRRHLIKALAATFTATQLVGLGIGEPAAATAATAAAATASPPPYDRIIGLL